jgi:hypothetical protein
VEQEPPPVASLADSIASADEGRQKPPPPLPRGWAGLVERDKRSRANSHPNAAGGYLNILYPWRLYIAVAGTVLVIVLLLVSAVR